MRKVNSEKFIGDLVSKILEETPNSNVVMIGPSTLDRDHSLAYFADLLSNTTTNLYVVDMPDYIPKASYGSLATVKRQFRNLRRNHPHLVRPKFIGCDAYNLEQRLGTNFADIIYDHNSLYHVALDKFYKSGQITANTAFDEIIRVYAEILKPKGKIFLMDEAEDFSWPLWEEVLPALNRHGLPYERYLIDDDINMSHQFPELKVMRGQRIGVKKAGSGIHYECKTVVVAEKPKTPIN